MMKVIKALCLAVFLLMPATLHAQYAHSFVFGGWSHHWKDHANKYNENHHIKGWEYGSDYSSLGLYKFKNSYSDTSYMLAVHERNCYQYSIGSFCYGVFAGYVTGYDKVFLIASPEVVAKYRITDTIQIGMSISCLPGLCAATTKLTF